MYRIETRQSWNMRTNSQKTEVLLPTPLVSSLSVTGMPQLLRILIDHGSQISLITEEAAQKYGLSRQKIRAEIAEIAEIGDSETRISKWKIKAQIKPRLPNKFIPNSEPLIPRKITTALRFNPCQIWTQIDGRIIDPTFNGSGPIDILLGAY
ncbi:hypothetical protein JTB14_027554 [Gonioctena quinquepunctata]|nr:hypothetical protein JTB14_027554 [Gonioctena quinquepunctata]